ncbi:S10 family serine carboxypeptidase-like protein [Burkholderia pseudomallei]|uniref:S10 family serine carboxypeptidase-like protein n=1 Tax=Burkholderia pseudomallei TaxID=28450 RepID=UPI000F06ABDD|nr:peptidase S10 [Burkholderia pseudomallei]MBO2979165.1 peptidase S10 [Burkholderia pseudomallei]MCW0024194.1 peptidase S10 [Burkholderia pseudomallei]MCW0156811.1 peptidase S10 [Burkholderia pseudomallei]MCW0171327.1 peptidase S10 [Burkholderia pseudomallei]CAJ3458815.1 serine-type carboxypeptidase family protein [Burkholderia pseudomallei]
MPARKAQLLLAAVFSSLLIAACNGDDAGSPASAAASENSSGNIDASSGADKPYRDPNRYSSSGSASLSPSAVTENAAITHHQITVNGKTINYTATAGHLSARNPQSGAAEASFFYVAYTADNQPLGKRPVTFFYNGGPGSSTVWLHLGSFGPKRLVTGDPNANSPTPFPFVDNQETLLDTTDLVFVDAIGTGFSEAIAPNTNQTFWGVDQDAGAFRDFVIRYLQVNQRNDSPKYLFGESYGTPRTDVLANLLETAGVKLDGIVLQSSILNYNSNCDMASNSVGGSNSGSSAVSCAGFVPSYGAIGAYYQLDNPNPANLPQYADQMRLLTAGTYSPAVDAYLANHTPPSSSLVTTMSNATGATVPLWRANFNLLPTSYDNSYQLALIPGTLIGRYDARVNVPTNSPLASDGDPSSSFITKPFTDTIGTYLPNVLKYTAKSAYAVQSNAIASWDWSHDGLDLPDTIPDLAAALTLNPALKVLSLNGYHDIATPFYQTELDLARLGAQPNLTIKDYQGGHMVYLDDTSRPQEKADLATFYAAAPAAR